METKNIENVERDMLRPSDTIFDCNGNVNPRFVVMMKREQFYSKKGNVHKAIQKKQTHKKKQHCVINNNNSTEQTSEQRMTRAMIKDAFHELRGLTTQDCSFQTLQNTTLKSVDMDFWEFAIYYLFQMET